jgi:Phage P22-like portal protein
MSSRDPEFDAISEKEIFDEACDRLAIAATSEGTNRNNAKYAMRFRDGEQWDKKPSGSVSMEEPELVINLMDSYITRVENNIRQQRPRGKCHPVGDGANIETAETINGLIRHIEVRSEAGVAYDQAARHALEGGWGYFRLVAEYLPDSLQRDLRILPIRNVFTVYVDPSAIMPTACDMGWGFVTVKQKKTEFKRLYPKAELVSWTDIGGEERTKDWESKEDIRLAEYFRVRMMEDTLYGLRNEHGQEFTRYGKDVPADLIKRWQESGMIQGQRDAVRRRVEWFKMNGLKVVAREQLPGTFIPLFRVEGTAVDIDGEVLRKGMVKAMIDPQRMVDYGEVAKIKRLGLAPKAPWVGAEGQFEGHPEWDNANTQPYSKLVYKPVMVETSQGSVLVPPPQRQAPAQIEAGFSEFVQGMRTNLLAIAGMENQPDVDKRGEVISGRALKQRSKMSDQSHFHYYDNLTLAIAQCCRVILEWAPVTFVEPGRLQRIIGEDSTPQMVKLNEESAGEQPGQKIIKNNLQVGRYDVVMDTGPGYESKREEGAETLIELINSAMGEAISKVGPDLVIRSIDHPYMQELADRFVAQTPEGLKKIMDELPPRARSIVQALGNENQQLKQALQKLELEKKYDIAGKHMAAEVKAHDVEETNKTRRHDTEIKSHTSIAVAEIREAGKLLDSHVEAEHNKEAAKLALESAERVEQGNGAA